MELTGKMILEMLEEVGLEYERLDDKSFALRRATDCFVEYGTGCKEVWILISLDPESLHVFAPDTFDIASPDLHLVAGLKALLAANIGYESRFELNLEHQKVGLRITIDLSKGTAWGFPERIEAMLSEITQHLDDVYEQISNALVLGDLDKSDAPMELADLVAAAGGVEALQELLRRNGKLGKPNS